MRAPVPHPHPWTRYCFGCCLVGVGVGVVDVRGECDPCTAAAARQRHEYSSIMHAWREHVLMLYCYASNQPADGRLLYTSTGSNDDGDGLEMRPGRGWNLDSCMPRWLCMAPMQNMHGCRICLPLITACYCSICVYKWRAGALQSHPTSRKWHKCMHAHGSSFGGRNEILGTYRSTGCMHATHTHTHVH